MSPKQRTDLVVVLSSVLLTHNQIKTKQNFKLMGVSVLQDLPARMCVCVEGGSWFVQETSPLPLCQPGFLCLRERLSGDLHIFRL